MSNGAVGGYLSLGLWLKEDTGGVRTRRRLRFGAIITVFDVASVGGGGSVTPADPVSFPPRLLLFPA